MATSIGATTFNAVYNTLTDGRCEVRFRNRTIAKAHTTGITKSHDYDDRGVAAELSGSIRYLTADDLDLQIGDAIEFRHLGATAWRKGRITDKYDIGGVTHIELEGVANR
jgi:hypothetical protein